MECLNCREEIYVRTIERGATLICSFCGCIQKSIDSDEYITRWRVMNPFDIENKRNSK